MVTSNDLRAAADGLRATSTSLLAASDRLQAFHGDLGGTVPRIREAWTSDLATVVSTRADTLVHQLQPIGPSIGEASHSVSSLASEATSLAEELHRHERAEIEAGSDLAAAQRQRAATDPSDLPALRVIDQRERAALERQRAARAGQAACERSWDAACRRTASELQARSVPLRHLAAQGPLWVPLNGRAGAGGGTWPQLRDFLFGDVLTFWGGGEDRAPIGAGLAGLIRMARMAGWAKNGGAATAFPTFANGGIGQFLSRAPGMGWLASPVTQTALTRLGFAGGLFTGVTGTWDLIQQGNPVTAFQDRGAGYTADLGRTAFGFGTAGLAGLALLGVAAPPVLVVATIGAGVVWLGSEIVDNWDTIVDWAGTAWDWTTDVASATWAGARYLGNQAWDAATDVASGAWDAATDVATGAWDAATDVASSAWDGATSVANTVTDTASNVANTVTDTASNVANTVTDTASNVANTVTDTASNVASSVSDTASNVASSAKDTLSNAPLVGGLFG